MKDRISSQTMETSRLKAEKESTVVHLLETFRDILDAVINVFMLSKMPPP